MTLTTWSGLADALVAELTEKGKLSSPEWQAAMRAVPRHEFVPSFYEKRDGAWQEVDAGTEPERWSQRVYANTSLVTQLGTLPGHRATGPTSSSSAPGLMARMLEALDIRDGHTVFEIGTGTGYNAALLSHRLGDDHVFSIDIDPGLVTVARDRLRRLGHTPHLAPGDGAAGWPGEPTTFDRIIATCAVDRVPWAWLDQTREGGLILVDFKIGTMAGNLVALRRTRDGAEGRFVDGFADFMGMRGDAPSPDVEHPERERARARRRATGVIEERPWEFPVWWFLACASMPAGARFGYTVNQDASTPEAVFLSCPDGSWAEVSLNPVDGPRDVWEAGPAALWSAVEQARDLWAEHGRPGWSRLGLTVTRGEHRVWLDRPDGPNWTLRP